MNASIRSVRDRMKSALARVLAPLLSLNDPQWGRRPGGGNNNQGPPDLDELWRNLNSRLSRLLGNKGGGRGGEGGGSEGPSPGMIGGGAGLVVGL
ncbi:MAG: protease modulator HflK N-terminal domain-containing protein, partial [Betaproteobacteria bacterium]